MIHKKVKRNQKQKPDRFLDSSREKKCNAIAVVSTMTLPKCRSR